MARKTGYPALIVLDSSEHSEVFTSISNEKICNANGLNEKDFGVTVFVIPVWTSSLIGAESPAESRESSHPHFDHRLHFPK
jgi:hypothetical protein